MSQRGVIRRGGNTPYFAESQAMFRHMETWGSAQGSGAFFPNSHRFRPKRWGKTRESRGSLTLHSRAHKYPVLECYFGRRGQRLRVRRRRSSPYAPFSSLLSLLNSTQLPQFQPWSRTISISFPTLTCDGLKTQGL